MGSSSRARSRQNSKSRPGKRPAEVRQRHPRSSSFHISTSSAASTSRLGPSLSSSRPIFPNLPSPVTSTAESEAPSRRRGNVSREEPAEEIAAEIVVSTDDLEFIEMDTDSELVASPTQSNSMDVDEPINTSSSPSKTTASALPPPLETESVSVEHETSFSKPDTVITVPELVPAEPGSSNVDSQSAAAEPEAIEMTPKSLTTHDETSGGEPNPAPAAPKDVPANPEPPVREPVSAITESEPVSRQTDQPNLEPRVIDVEPQTVTSKARSTHPDAETIVENPEEEAPEAKSSHMVPETSIPGPGSETVASHTPQAEMVPKEVEPSTEECDIVSTNSNPIATDPITPATRPNPASSESGAFPTNPQIQPSPQEPATSSSWPKPSADEQDSAHSPTALAESEPNSPDLTHTKSAISHLIVESRTSFASSASAISEQSELSSIQSPVSSKATTPVDMDSSREAPILHTPTSIIRPRSSSRQKYNVRPKVSIPDDMEPTEYASQCIEAAEDSRLNPYALHQEEYLLLRSHLSHAQVTNYLNIRNGILKLWVCNSRLAVTREEAIGCAKDSRWFDVASICFDWLVRRGYINYGCVGIEAPEGNDEDKARGAPIRRRTVAVIGAGFSGLGCARQLEGLFCQYSRRFREIGEDPPRVVVLEGRNRVGGRVYSRAFETRPDFASSKLRGRRFTAEMGGMIITGFERGNPLNILLRGQLGLQYHLLKANMTLYNLNGKPVDQERDQMVEKLFNACLDRVSVYKFKMPTSKLIEGNRVLMDEARDSSSENCKTIAHAEETAAAQPHGPPVSEQNKAPQVNLVPVSIDRMIGRIHTEPGTPGSQKAAFKAKSYGWTLKDGVTEEKDVDLDAASSDPNATLGSVMDEAIMQHKDILELNAQDFRLLNWHIANLEYSNATSLNRLSLQGWDIDAGNEWEGDHTMVIGGYQSVAAGLLRVPTPLDLRREAVVKRISYTGESSTVSSQIICEDGTTVEADYIVNTLPLGVLKHGDVEFQPPLPLWKTDAIQRLGYGVLNKVILVYEEPFWDTESDIFGILQSPANSLSISQNNYSARRGRFFQWFNVSNTTGMPCLLALMGGDAGYDTEHTPNNELIKEATELLRSRFGPQVTDPVEAFVTRWASDRFARGSYSSAGVTMRADDYDIMARPVGNQFFAGEHTIATHPATVHGAYLSGLRAASEVLEAMLGPIEVPTPLIIPREGLKRKAPEAPRDLKQARLEAYEAEILEHLQSRIGPYPPRPPKMSGNAYLLYAKANYELGRKRCEEGRRAGKGKPSPNEVRGMTSRMWKEASAEEKKPFEDQAEEQKKVYAEALRSWTAASTKWEQEAKALREAYVKEHPSVPSPEELAAERNPGRRRAKRVRNYAENEGSDVDMTDV